MPIIIVCGFVISVGLHVFVNVVYAMLGIYMFYYIAPYFHFITNNSFFKAVNRNSFGIYLFHPIIIYFTIFYIKNSQVGLVVIFCVTLCSSFLLSLLFTEFMRKLNLQVLIGEKIKNDNK